MTRKIIAILAALLITFSLFACGGDTESSGTTGTIEAPSQGETTDANSDSNNGGDEAETEAGDPDDYTYEECDATYYVYLVGGGNVTLRSESFEYICTIPHATELKVIAVSTDSGAYWSKVSYNGKTGYVASKFLTTINVNNPQGFDAVSKQVEIEPLTGSLKVYDIPAMNSLIIGYVTSDAPVKVIGVNKDAGWYKIEFVDANNETKIGYIASNSNYFVGGDEAETETTTEAETEVITETETVETVETETATDAETDAEVIK